MNGTRLFGEELYLKRQDAHIVPTEGYLNQIPCSLHIPN